jgi:Domain of unknown function (DU1801)
MAEAKTKPTTTSLDDFLAKSVDPTRHDDCRAIAAMMQKATGEPPVMWGSSIVGFGRYHYKYDSGREGESVLVGFSPRKNDLTIYIIPGFDRYETLLAKLGKHKTGKSCLYVKRLADIDTKVLKAIIEDSVKSLASKRIV